MLDWKQFYATCKGMPELSCKGMPELSARLANIVTSTLRKVELKAFLNGMFIEPGTVIRGDDTDGTDSQSVIFSCIPYFDIQNPLSNASTRSKYLFPARTLMQSFYPDEPVQERDKQQAYRKFENGQKGGLIHVPTLWMMNIGSHAVVTCRHKLLSTDLVNSIKVVKEDRTQLSGQSNKLTTIRVTYGEQRVNLLFSLAECKTYFEMERKLKELSIQGSRNFESLQLLYTAGERLKKVTPASWLCIISQRNAIFIDLSLTDDPAALEKAVNLTPDDFLSSQPSLFTQNLVPPFFEWPNPPPDYGPTDTPTILSDGCLRLLEDTLMDDEVYKSDRILLRYSQAVFNSVRSSLLSQTQKRAIPAGLSHQTYHQMFVETQCSEISSRANDMVEIVLDTVKLFVHGVDGSTVIRKVWGAMSNIASVAGRMSEMRPREDHREYTDPEWYVYLEH
jgi:hypothetical protein